MSDPSVKTTTTSDDGSAGASLAQRLAAGGIAVALTCITGVFAALGIQGDLLGRLIRNDSQAVTASFVLAIVGVVVGLAGVAVRRPPKARTVLGGLGVVLITAGACLAVWEGAATSTVRDMPTLSLEPLARSSAGSSPSRVTLRATAAGPYLQSDERLILRVMGFTTTDRAWTTCSTLGVDPALAIRGTILSLTETGPATNGIAQQSVTLDVDPARYPLVCVHAALSPRVHEPEQRFVSGLLNVAAVGLPPSAQSVGLS